MARRNVRPASVEELFKGRKTEAGKEKANSLRKTKPRTVKPKAELPDGLKVEKPRKPSKQEQQRQALGLNPSEDEVQMCIMDWAKLQRWGKYSIFDYIHHSPNGGKRSMIEGVRFKKMGTKAGFPDLFLPIAVEPFNGLFIELKTETGVVSEAQKAYMPMLVEQGYRVQVCFTAMGGINVIKNYLGLNE